MLPIKYSVRSLFARRGVTLMTMLSIAFVVLIYNGVLALAGGLHSAFAASGDPLTVLVLRDGARSEMESGFDTESWRILELLPGIARDPQGHLLASPETVHLQVMRRSDGSESNVSIRAVEDAAFYLRPQIQVVEGRRFEPGKAQIIVGSNLPARYPELRLGNRVRLGRGNFQVVGVFESAGGSFSSEIWGDVHDLGDAYRRSGYYSSVRLRAASRSAMASLMQAVRDDQRLRVEPMEEPVYYQRQRETSSRFIVWLGNGLGVLMAFGACFAAANTMYAQVAARQKEIGTLRALGFGRLSILGVFLLEAGVLGLTSGALGAALSLPLNSLRAGTMNSLTFSEITFSLHTSPMILGSGLLLALATAVVGGLPPAVAASRRGITELLRQA